MEKVSYGSLMIEVTRKCNLKCKHCMRGETQNCELSYNVIDNLLDRMNGVEMLAFTGGEPLLAIDKIEYILNGIMKRNIIVCEMQIITNGTCFNENMVDIFKQFHNYMKNWYERIYEKEFTTNYIKSHLQFAISSDKYHETDSDGLYNHINSLIGEYMYVHLYARGNQVKNIGRAKTMLNCGVEPDTHGVRRIEMYGKNKHCYCRMVTNDMIKNQPDNLTIMCPVAITAKGILVQSMEIDFETEDLPKYYIADFNYNDLDIEKCVDEYNKDKRLCIHTDKVDDSKHNNRHNTLDIKIKANDVLEGYENYLNDELEKSDSRYATPYMSLSEEERYAIYKGDTIEMRMVDMLAQNLTRDKNEIIAEEWFGYSGGEKYKEIKLKYPHLTHKECIKFLHAGQKDVIDLKYKNFKRKIYLEIAEGITDNQRSQNMWKEYKFIIENKFNGNYEKAYEIYKTTHEKRLSFTDASIKMGEGISLEQFKICVDELNEKVYSNEDRWIWIKNYMCTHFKDIIKNFELSGIPVYSGKRIDVKEMIYERICYCLCYNELKNCSTYKQYYDEDVRTYGNVPSLISFLESSADAIETSYNNILDNDLVIFLYQNQIDELCELPKTYEDDIIAKATVKNILKSIGTSIIINKMNKLGKELS